VNPTPLERLREIPVEPGRAAVTWLGQAGFAVRGVGTTALMDPFLSPYQGRRYESTLMPEQCEDIDVVLCTHEHVDHLDRASVGAIARRSPRAVFVVPSPIVDMVTETGVAADRVVGMQPGEAVDLGALTVRAVPARHGVTMDDAYGFGEELSGGSVRFLGYVLDVEGVRLYHAGDTIHYEGMEATLRDLRPDVAMLPINGRDAEREARGIVGNLDEREAAWLAEEMDAGVLVPMHHDLFAGNRGWPAHVVEWVEREDRNVTVLVPPRDTPFTVTGRPR
jgi:L-ascorbate 6-phosphate lactonase